MQCDFAAQLVVFLWETANSSLVKNIDFQCEGGDAAVHGCLKWLFIDFFSKMSHFISQKSWKLVANNQIY